MKLRKEVRIPHKLTRITAFLIPIIGVMIGIKIRASPNPITP
jgi:hypothetical protein